MTDTACTFENRDDVIVGYLYDDLEPRARHAFEDHVVGCHVCRTELEDLRGVRADLAQWAKRLESTGWKHVYAYFMHEPTAPAYAQALMRHAGQ